MYSYNLFIKNELFLNQVSVLENSCMHHNSNINVARKIPHKMHVDCTIYIYYIYYFYLLNLKVILLTSEKFNKIISLDRIFKSLCWLERESSEMFGIYYNNKLDIRRLLLDYSKNENPLLKNYPLEGFNNVYFNFFDDQVCTLKSDVIEL